MEGNMEESVIVRDAVILPPNITFTENASYTFNSTTSACLDFYFDVMQNTSPEHIKEMLAKSWEENPLLTLKLIFQLRDVRNGKASISEFHHCIIWLFKHHPQTLTRNLEHVPKHGYWKDLSLLVKFIMEDKVALTNPRQMSSNKNMYSDWDAHLFGNDSDEESETSADDESSGNQDLMNGLTLDEAIRKRVNGEITKRQLHKYVCKLPNAEERKQAKSRFHTLMQEIHSEHHEKAVAKKKSLKKQVALKVSKSIAEKENYSVLYSTVVKIFCDALKRDSEALKKDGKLESTWLAAKWAPSIGSALDSSTLLGKSIARSLYESEVRKPETDELPTDYDMKAFSYYRKQYLAPLREHIHVAERFMSKRKWSEIKYERVPSVSMKRNKKIFLGHDADRFKQYLEDVEEGKKKIASGALLPHQIVEQFLYGQADSQESEKVAELQWQSYVDNLKKSGVLQSAISVCDVSGSMSGDPMIVAIALSLLTAAVSKPPFNGYVVSFSATPNLHMVNQPTLREKVQFTSTMDWGMNTNMQAVFNMILRLAHDTNLPRDEMVKTIFVYSDMEFDECGGKEFETDYQLIKRKFEDAGYPLPGIVFWNLRGGARSKPVTKDEKNVALVSGFSGQMLKVFLEKGEFSSPYQTMMDTLGNHYDHLQVYD